MNLNGKQVPGTKDKFGPDLLQNFALDFIRRHKNEPFFLYYPSPLIHTPLRSTPDSLEPDPKKSKTKNTESIYQENLTYLDKQVGQIVAQLEKLNIRENTLIIFAGDNGSLGVNVVFGRTIDGGKHDLTEGGSRVPLIANWPGATPAGVVKKDLIVFTDVLPTFVELAGGKLAPGIKIDGQSFAPQIHGEAGTPREWIYMQLHTKFYIRDSRWKLTGKGEFFDMKEAPFKEIPVPKTTTDPEARAARERLQRNLDQLLASASAELESPEAKKKKGEK